MHLTPSDRRGILMTGTVFLVALIVQLKPLPDDLLIPPSVDISQPHASNTIPYPVLFLIDYVAIPLILWMKGAKKLEVVYFLSLAIQYLAVHLLKNWVARPRLDTAVACGNSYEECKDHLKSMPLKNQFTSFPSGHAAEAVSVGFLLILVYWNANINITSRFIFALCLTIYGFLVGLSRVQDRKHRVDEVIVGSVVGAISAVVAYSYDKIQKHRSRPTLTDSK